MTPNNSTRKQFADMQKEIKESSLQDFKDWVRECVEAMERANNRGNAKKVFQLTKRLAGKPKPPPVNLVTDGNGKLLQSPEETADVWHKFLKEKFAATSNEAKRGGFPPLRTARTAEDELTKEEFLAAVGKLKSSKAMGPDEVPAEVFKLCPAIRDELFYILNYIWQNEKVPQNLACGKFVMVWKRKGSSDDPSKYRCLCLLNHAYKALAIILLQRLLTGSVGFLKDWQNGFRAMRGCRDNNTILRTICEKMLMLGKKIAVTFIDYTAAFDTVSHLFIDEALAKAKVSTKVRAMFRAIYHAATAFTAVKSTDGGNVNSASFPINRGVVQGDITSPLYFILALELIFRRHDKMPGKGVALMDTVLHTLGYADDVATIEEATPEGHERATNRVSAIANGSQQDADMSINIPKTKVLQVGPQESVSPTTAEEARAVCKYTCRHEGCNHCFMTKHGLLVHEGRCEWKNEFVVDSIVDHDDGDMFKRKYLIKWKGCADNENTWEPRSQVHHELIKEYELAKGIYADWPHRCPTCDKPCASATGVKIHAAKAHKPEEPQKFTGSLADKAVKTRKLTELQQQLPQVHCNSEILDNVFRFKYLGSAFTADGDKMRDVKARTAMATQRWGTMRHIFNSPHLSLTLKLRLYSAAVCSVMTYGSESWFLTKEVLRAINGANSRLLSRFTGKTVQQEARPATTSLNLTRRIRKLRLRWLGQILRSGPQHLIFKAVEEQHRHGMRGGLLMDAPPSENVHDLIPLANDREAWCALVRKV